MKVFGNMLNIGLSGLTAYKAALLVTSNNISNTEVANYSRRQIVLNESSQDIGVNVTTIQRVADAATNQAAQTSQSNYYLYSTALQNLQNLQQMFTTGSTVGALITSSYTTLKNIQTDAGSAQKRGMYFSNLTDMVGQFQNITGQISTEQSNINLSLQTTVNQVNQVLTNIANINQQLTLGIGTQDSLLDEQQGLLTQLAQYIGFTTLTDQTSGAVTLNLSNGVQLVSGMIASQFQAINDPTNSSNLIVSLKTSNGTLNINDLINTGSMGALLLYRANTFQAQRDLDRLSLNISQALNTQNKLGIDGNGTFGQNIFSDINTANAMAGRVFSNSNNTGSSTMTVNVTDPTKLSDSDYTLLVGAGNTYTINRLSDHALMGSGTLSGPFPQNITVADGFTITVGSGTFNPTDQYTISPTRNASGLLSVIIPDSSKLAFAWPVAVSNGIKQQGSSGSINVTSITNPSSTALSTPGQLTPPIQIQFVTSGGVLKYNLMDMTNPASPVLLEGPITYTTTTGTAVFPTPGGYDPGYRVSLSGTIQAGDTFNIAYNTNSTSDNRNALAMSNIYDKGTVQNGTLSFIQAYNSASVSVSLQVNTTQTNYTTSLSIKNAAEDAQASISGVNVEEETLNLVQYQEAYQANAQVLQAAKAIFDMLIGLMR